ncbi:MAG: phosphatidylinositol-specific phospholipase C domain-containing protein [Eubacterium sp.]
MVVDLEKWMSSIDDSVNLMSLNIPGTHDCVTQYVQLSHFAKCQDKNIYDQLRMGVRALDIRVQSVGDRLGMVHGIAKAYNSANPLGEQMDLAYVLDYCYRFLEKNPYETIIFQFKNDSNKEMEKCFDNLYRRYIKEYPTKWYTENRIPNLGEVRGKIVLIRRCKMYENSAEYSAENAGIDFSRWVEQDEAVPQALVLETDSLDNARFIIQDRFKYKPEPRWNECIKPFLDNRKTFNGEYVICYFSTAGGLKGPESNAKYINPRLFDYPLEKGKYYGIMYLDFPSEDITEKIISTN